MNLSETPRLNEMLGRLPSLTVKQALDVIPSIEREFHVKIEYQISEGSLQVVGYSELQSINS